MMLIAESTSETIFFFGLSIAAYLAIRIGLHYIDRTVIQSAARLKGWKRIEVNWAPFASGWLFEKGERHYRVDYDDKDGSRKSRYCKTGLLTGLYWRD